MGNEERKRCVDLRSQLLNDETAIKAFQDFETQKTVTVWELEETPGQYNMVCNELKRNCHMNCSIQKGLVKSQTLKGCKCFQWRAAKELRVVSEADRKTLLDKIEDIEWRLLAQETGAKQGSRVGICSKQNFQLNGTLVRGDPDTQYTTSLFST